MIYHRLEWNHEESEWMRSTEVIVRRVFMGFFMRIVRYLYFSLIRSPEFRSNQGFVMRGLRYLYCHPVFHLELSSRVARQLTHGTPQIGNLNLHPDPR